MGDIIQFPGPTAAPIPPATILEKAAEREFTSIVVMGFTADGDLYAASSTSDGGEVLWMMERAKRRMHEWADKQEAEE